MLAAFGSDAYKIVLVLHILCAIIGFGAVFLNGLYGAQAAKYKGPEGLAITRRTSSSRRSASTSSTRSSSSASPWC